jgi:pimeloyl-ACP methyl ester carboxylesterase
MEIAHVNGIELEYEVTGSGEPVLLISPVLADGFGPLVSERKVADRYRLISYHRRGWAGSSHTPPPVTIADHATDAVALLDHLGVPCAHIAGHGSGAAVATQLALDHPGTVHALILMELSIFAVPSTGAFFQQAGPAFAAYESGDHEGAFGLFMSAVSGLDQATVRALLDECLPGAAAQAIKDADTFFGIELPPSPTGRSAPNRRPPSTAPCCPCSAPTPGCSGWRPPSSCARHSRASKTARSMASVISCTSKTPSPSPGP